MNNQSTLLRGLGIGGRRVSGRLKFFHRGEIPRAAPRKKLDVAGEEARLNDALSQTANQIALLYDRALRSLGESEAQIFEIHGMLLEDEDFRDALLVEIKGGSCAEDALDAATKAADVTVCYGRSFYAGAGNASTPYAGEVIGILAGPTPGAVHSGMESVLNELQRVGFEEVKGVPVLAHTVSRCGSFLAKEAGVKVIFLPCHVEPDGLSFASNEKTPRL